MAEYIDREKVLDILASRNAPWDAYVNVSRLKFEDVQPMQYGKNIGSEYADCDQFVCSECGIELQNWYSVERDEDDWDITHHEYVFRYCPNCGAKILMCNNE